MVASIHDDDPSAVARTFVFGYGSLVARVPPAPGGLTVLAGVRRMWGVAMDNAVEVPGYKRYRHPGTGAAPACLVTFLDLGAADADAPGVNGGLLEVDDARLAALDARERNYDRVEVTGRLHPPAAGRVFVFVGSAAGRARAAQGRTEGTGIVPAGYLALVERAFAAHGADELVRYRASTDAPGLPVRELERVEVGPVIAGDGTLASPQSERSLKSTSTTRQATSASERSGSSRPGRSSTP